MGMPGKGGKPARRLLVIEFTDGSAATLTITGRIDITISVARLPGQDASGSFAHRFLAGSPNVGTKVSYAVYGEGGSP